MNPSRLKLWRLWRRFEKATGAHAKRRGELAQHGDIHAPLAGLVPADRAFRDAGELGQLLLGEPALLSPLSQIQPGIVSC